MASAVERRLLLRGLLLAPAVAPFAACLEPRGRSPSLRVELDVYSGRPNPAFDLSGSDADELARRLSGLPLSRSTPPDAGLGYRGFLITGGTPSSVPENTRIHAGMVTVPRERGVAVYSDARDAEGWLKQRARQAGLQALVP